MIVVPKVDGFICLDIAVFSGLDDLLTVTAFWQSAGVLVFGDLSEHRAGLIGEVRFVKVRSFDEITWFALDFKSDFLP